MILLAIGVTLFVLVHLVPSVIPLRSALRDRLGEGAYRGAYSLLALTGLILMIYGKAYTDYLPIWNPPQWTRYLTWVVMIPALFLIVAANVPGNIKRFTPHPMMWAVLIWSATHLAANGDLASIILFAPLGIFAVIHIITANSRGATTQTDVLPFAADMKILGMSLVSYAILAVAHPYFFKMPAF